MKTPTKISAAAWQTLVNEAFRSGGEGGSAIAGLDRGANNRTGEIYIANESRFVESNFSEPLTTYATGWKDPNNIEETLEHVAPVVPVGRRFEFASATNAEEFLSEVDDIRAIGAAFKRIEYTSHKTNAKTLNKGLTIRVDDDNVAELPNWEQVYTGRILRRLWRNELRRAVTLLIAAGTNTAVTWNQTLGKDPDMDAETVLIAFQDAAGVPATRGLYGRNAWNKRKLSHRFQNTAGGFASAGLTPDEVAEALGIDALKVSNERYQLTATTKSKVVPDVAVFYNAEENQSPEDPSNIKRFVSPTLGGTPVRVYVERIGAKFTDITVEHYSNIIITSTLGIQVLTVS